jgi:hypothetical protein
LQDFVVEVFEERGLRGEGEVLLGTATAGGTEARSECGIAENRRDAVSEYGFIARRSQESSLSVGDGLFHSGAAKADDGHGHGLSLAYSHVESLRVPLARDDTGCGEQAGAPEEIANNVRGLPSEEDALRSFEPSSRGCSGAVEGLAGEGAERVEQRAIADNEELRLRAALLQLRHGADEVSAAFYRDQPADEEDDRIAGAGLQRVRGEDVEVDADGEGAKFVCREAAIEGVTAEVVGDAEEQGGASVEVGLSAQVGVPGRGAAEEFGFRCDVVAMEGDDQRQVEAPLQWERRGRVHGEVGVEERGMDAAELAQEFGCDAGMEEQAATDFVGERVGASERNDFAGVELEAVGDATETG